MINLGQVVAAMAVGAMLAIAIVLVFQLHSWQRRDTQQPETDQETARDQRIEAASRFADEYFDEFYDELTSDDDEDKPRKLPYGTKVVRSKGHLHLIGASAAAIASITAVAREALREHRGLAGATIGGLATAGAVTTLTLTPWTSDNHAGPPQPSAPSATSWPSPTPPPGNSMPTPSGPANPAPSTSDTAPPPSASPSPSPSSTSIAVTSPRPTPPALSPAAPAPAAPGQGRGRQDATPPGHDRQDQNGGNGRPRDGDEEEDGESSEQSQLTGQLTIEAILCGGAAVGPLLDVDACLRGVR